jgi:hypothetical protein
LHSIKSAILGQISPFFEGETTVWGGSLISNALTTLVASFETTQNVVSKRKKLNKGDYKWRLKGRFCSQTSFFGPQTSFFDV